METKQDLFKQLENIEKLFEDGSIKKAQKNLRDTLSIVKNEKGVRVSVVSTNRSEPSLIADELRRQCDNFIELNVLRDKIERPTNTIDDQNNET